MGLGYGEANGALLRRARLVVVRSVGDAHGPLEGPRGVMRRDGLEESLEARRQGERRRRRLTLPEHALEARRPVPHMVHGLSSAPRGRCTVWECTMCGVWRGPPALEQLARGRARRRRRVGRSAGHLAHRRSQRLAPSHLHRLLPRRRHRRVLPRALRARRAPRLEAGPRARPRTWCTPTPCTSHAVHC